MHIDTLAVHAARKLDPHKGPGVHYEHGAVVPPVHLASTYELDTSTHDGPFAYQRGSNPTRGDLERALAAVEGAKYGFAFATGMAATAAAFSLLRHGDEVLLSASVYGGTFRLVNSYFEQLGVTARFFDDLGALTDADFSTRTRLVFVETPGNPTLRVVDLQRIAELARAHDALLVVDNTFLTGVLQRPLELGAHLVVQSGTKFLGGHSDLLAGVVTTNDPALAEKIALNQKAYGGVLEPLTAFRLLQSLKALPLRLERQQANAGALAEFLRGHSGVARVLTAGSHSETEAKVQRSQAQGTGAVFSFELAPGLDQTAFLSALAIPAFAVSLGGVESLICVPATMSHDGMTQEARDRAGITHGLIRFSAGIENIADLIADFEQALSAAKSTP